MNYANKLSRRPYLAWLTFYIFLNIAYLAFIYHGGLLYGEANVVEFKNPYSAILILILLLFSYIFFQALYLSLLFRIRVPRLKFSVKNIKVENAVGFTLMVLQVAFAIYFVSSGTHIAGSGSRDDSLFSLFWVLVPVDVLMFIYYGMYRTSSLFYPNSAIWVISNLVRGWSGVILTILFFESARLMRTRAIKFRSALFGIGLFLIAYPLIYFGKLFVRFAAQSQSAFAEFVSLYGSLDMSELLLMAFQQIFDRLQLISSGIAVYNLSDNFKIDLAAGKIYPFWLEGLHGIALDRLLGQSPRLSAGQAFASYLDPASIDVNWNSNPTFIGWFFISPEYFLLNLVYPMLLAFGGYYLMRKISNSDGVKDVVWYASLVLLIPGWYGAYFLFFYATVLMLILHLIVHLFAFGMRMVSNNPVRPP